VQYSAPVSDETRLQAIPAAPDRPESVEAILNGNLAKLNDLLFTYLDYAAIGERL
jgi:hypothetical protein